MSARATLYESPDDLAREKAAIEQVSKRLGVTVEKMPTTSPVDFALMLGRRVVGWCEVKTRNKSMAEIESLGGFLINTGKLIAVKQLSEISGKPFVLVLRASDGLWWLKMKVAIDFVGSEIFVQGRRDRNDPDDIETCACFPVTRFKPLGVT